MLDSDDRGSDFGDTTLSCVMTAAMNDSEFLPTSRYNRRHSKPGVIMLRMIGSTATDAVKNWINFQQHCICKYADVLQVTSITCRPKDQFR
jgi:hypothetical protein